MTNNNQMEFTKISGTDLTVSRIGLGTWAIGGWMWGGSDEGESIKTIHAAIGRGITLIDTAPVYGFGRSEEIVGKALAEGGLRNRVVIATKAGLDLAQRATVSQRQLQTNLRRGRAVAQTAAHRLYRHLPGSLA